MIARFGALIILVAGMIQQLSCAGVDNMTRQDQLLKEDFYQYPETTLFFGGPILTMNDAQPRVEAVAIRDGRIVGVGDKETLLNKFLSTETFLVDLQGKTMVPGFIDGHSHFFQAAMTVDYINISGPPVGPAATIKDIVTTLQNFKQEKKFAPHDWIIGYGYDASAYKDNREAVKEDFDVAFPTNPIALIHVSGHGVMLNSAAMKKLDITAETKTPTGGIIARKENSMEPAGLLMENAWFMLVLPKLPHPNQDELVARLVKAQLQYAKNGYTTVQDAPADPHNAVPVYLRAQKEKQFFLDLVAYADPNEFPKLLEEQFPFSNSYKNGVKFPGVKLLVDGSPQGRTAFFSQPYLSSKDDSRTDYRGAPIIGQEKINKLVDLAYKNKLQVLAHVNGDAAIEMIIKAHEAVEGEKNSRTVLVHSQFVRRDQLDKYAQYNMIPSFFTNHAFFWGDEHIKNLGEERANFLSPMKTALSLGLKPTNHSDFLVTPLDPMFILWTSVNRESRSKKIIGADERLTPMEGLKALTVHGAYQYFEEKSKGSIEENKVADLVILSHDPTTVEPNFIKEIKIVETIKGGTRVYAAHKN